MTKEQFLLYLKAYRRILPRNVLLSLRGQALAGDISAAQKGLARYIDKHGITPAQAA